METTDIADFARRDGITDALTELLKTGAQQLVATAVQAELECFMAHFEAERTEADHAAVVRNGHHPARPFQTGIGPVSVRIPKVRSKKRPTRDIPFSSGAALCAQNKDARSGVTVAVSEGDVRCGDGPGPQGSFGP